MSLAMTVGVGTLVGGVAAFAVYTAAAPGPPAPAPAPVTFAPIPTPTVTRTADGCVPPAVVNGDGCLVVRPGPTVVVTGPAPAPRTSAPRTSAPLTAAPGTASDEVGSENENENEGEGDGEDGADDHGGD